MLLTCGYYDDINGVVVWCLEAHQCLIFLLDGELGIRVKELGIISSAPSLFLNSY